ncbi:hypothetical protein Tco_0099524 [Tanacetum coccineum]
MTLTMTRRGIFFFLNHFSMMIHHYPLPLKETICLKFEKNLKFVKLKLINLSIDEPPKVRLKDLLFISEFEFWKITFKFPSTLMIKKRKHSRVLTERSPTVACLLAYAMHQARSKDKMLQRCEDTNLCLNWEKSHFMVKESIILGHQISKNGIEVDKAKVDVIAKLPHPTTVKGV